MRHQTQIHFLSHKTTENVINVVTNQKQVHLDMIGKQNMDEYKNFHQSFKGFVEKYLISFTNGS